MKVKTTITVEREIEVSGTYHKPYKGNYTDAPEPASVEDIVAVDCLLGKPFNLQEDELREAEEALIEQAETDDRRERD